MNKIGKSVGEKIRAARVALKYTQSKLASPDFSVSYISAIERGQIFPSLRALEIIASRLGIPSAQLMPQRSKRDETQRKTPVQPERDDDEGELALLSAYRLLSEGKALDSLTRLGKVSARRLRIEQQYQYRYLTARAYFLLQRFQECEHLLISLVEATRGEDHLYIHLHALDLLGETQAALHNYNAALSTHRQCLDLLQRMTVRDPFFIFRVLSQLGEHSIQVDALDDAREMFTSAIEVAHEFETPAHVQTISFALSTYYKQHNDQFAATLYIYKTIFAHEQQGLRRQRSDLFYALGKTIVAGKSESGYETLDAMLTQARQQDQEPLTLAALDVCLADWLFAYQRVQESRQSIVDALALARPSGDSLLVADALLLLGRIEYEQQEYEESDTHTSEGLHMLERLHVKAEFARAATRYAQQLEARGKGSEALFYYRKAFQSRQEHE
jgi:transcriptional regulator with XRE-family HTH domain